MLRKARLRLSSLGLTFLGVALATVIVGVALALVTISITGTAASNEFVTTTTTTTSTTTTLPPGDGLQAAISTDFSPASCANAITAGSLSLGAISFDLNNPAAQSYAPQAFLCVTNVLAGGANEITTLTVQATLESSTEDTCSADEMTTDPDGPLGCGTVGELGTVVEVVLIPANLQDAGCFNSSQSIVPGGGSVSLLNGGGGGSALSFGAFCSWEVKLQLSGSATYDQKLAASTDSIALKLDVNGSGT